MTKIIVGIFFIGSRKVNYGVKRKKNISSLFISSQHKWLFIAKIYGLTFSGRYGMIIISESAANVLFAGSGSDGGEIWQRSIMMIRIRKL